MSDDELVARVNMADAKFSFQEKGKMYHPAWIAPEVYRQMIRYLLIWSSLNHVLAKILVSSARSQTRNSVSGIEEKSG